MKRIFALIIAAVMLFSFTACGKENGDSGDDIPVAESTLDLEVVYQSLLNMQAGTGLDALVMFKETDPNLLNQLYAGLADVRLKQQVVYMAPVTGYACEVMLVEAVNEADMQKVEEVFNNRISIGIESNGDADNGEVWQRNARVQVFGNYAAMIVLPDGYLIPDNIFE